MAHIAAISFNRANSILELFRCDIFMKRLWEPLHGLLATCLHFLEYIAFSINIDQIRWISHFFISRIGLIKWKTEVLNE